MPMILGVKHNIEVAHRLFELPGKCEQIHGHSMWVTLELKGELNEHGIMNGIEFGELKRIFREHLDTQYDHRVLLNEEDDYSKVKAAAGEREGWHSLPGTRLTPGDPTTENIASWIAHYMIGAGYPVSSTTVWETAVNMARWEA